MSVANTRPRLARVLLRTICDHTGEADTKLGAFTKTVDAMFQREFGTGKTKVFAYLSTADKLRVLSLSGAEGAEGFGHVMGGKTAFFASLPGEVKYRALHAWQAEREASGHPDTSPPTTGQLLRVALTYGAPMVGFGFVDNFLMILFGESIDAFFGMYVSTMGAAGLGNLCSNLFGLGLADYIEHASERMGIPPPGLSPSQRETRIVHVMGGIGTILGVTVGCLLGMAPLLFFPHAPHADAAQNAEQVTGGAEGTAQKT